MGIDVALIGVWVSGVFLSRKVFRDTFAPLGVYVSVWCACLLLFRLHLIMYDPLEPRTWLLIGAGMTSFVVGCLLAAWRPIKRRNRLRPGLASLAAFRLTIFVLLTLATTGTISFAVRMARLYRFQTYFTEPSVIRADSENWTSMGALGALVLLCYPLFVCSFIDVLNTKKVSWYTALGLIVPVVETYLSTGRGNLITFMICAFFIWIYHSKRRSLDRKVVLFLAVGIVCGLIFFLAVGGLYDKLVKITSPAAQYAKITPDSEFELRLLDPYIYATGEFPAFQAATKDLDGWSWGTQSLYPVARVLYKVGLLERKPGAASFTFYFVPIPFNTYTWLFTFYSDFGIYGVLLLPGVVGWGETRLYLRMREIPTIFSVSGSAALAAATALTPFGFIQYDFILWYFLLVMFFVSQATRVTRHDPRAGHTSRATTSESRRRRLALLGYPAWQ